MRSSFKTGLNAVALSMLVMAPQVNAVNIADAFESAASTSGGMAHAASDGSFRTATQFGYNFGGGSIRIPVKELSLVTVDKARFAAGCNGIDAHFGGFSFIDGDELLNTLKLIAKGVPTLLYTMTLKAIAAPLMAAIGRLQDTLTGYTANLNNTCQAGEALLAATSASITGNSSFISDKMDGVAKAGSDWVTEKMTFRSTTPMNTEESGARNKCWVTLLTMGLVSDMGRAKEKNCGGNAATKNTAATFAQAVGSDPYKQTLFADQYGNTTWNMLQAVGLAPSDRAGDFFLDHKFSYFLMSLVGTTIKHKDGSTDKPEVFNAPLKADQFLSLYMCGDSYMKFKEKGALSQTPTGLELRQAWIREWCQDRMGDISKIADAKKFAIIRCEDGMSDMKLWMDGCKHADIYQYDRLMMVEEKLGDGMLIKTMNLLSSAVDKASTGQALNDQEKTLLAMAPFPLYRVLNIAAAEPLVADELLQSNALILAFHLTSAMVMGVVNRAVDYTTTRYDNSASSLPESLMQSLSEIQRSLQLSAVAEISRTDLFKQTADSIMKNVTTVNNQILNSAMGLGMGGGQFAEALTLSVTGAQ